jgi:hypothetical protein
MEGMKPKRLVEVGASTTRPTVGRYCDPADSAAVKLRDCAPVLNFPLLTGAARQEDSMNIGDRVQLHPGTDRWMMGDRYGTIVGKGRSRIGYVIWRVKLDFSGKTLRFCEQLLNPA